MTDLTPATQTPADAGTATHELLPDALRVVLGSHQKFALLSLLDSGPKTSPELSASLAGQLQVKAINLHLKELETLGWIIVVDLVPVAGGQRKTWGLNTAPGWRELFAAIRATAPDLPEDTI